MQPEQEGEPQAAHGLPAVDLESIQRIRAMVETVHDLTASLGRLSRQLESEVGRTTTTATDRRPRAAGPGRSIDVDAIEQENAQLRSAIEGRAVIEQAKGMLMAEHGCDPDRAFSVLTEVSRREQRKVRDVAADVVARGTRPGADLLPRPARPADRAPRRIDLR